MTKSLFLWGQPQTYLVPVGDDANSLADPELPPGCWRSQVPRHDIVAGEGQAVQAENSADRRARAACAREDGLGSMANQ